MDIKKYNTTKFSVDSPDPTILPDNIGISTGSRNVSENITINRESIQHETTHTRNTITTPKTSAVEQRVGVQTSTSCNCGVNTGYRYSFEITYKKSDLLKNQNTNEVRRDWLYIQLIGNFDEKNIKTDRFLIYLK